MVDLVRKVSGGEEMVAALQVEMSYSVRATALAHSTRTIGTTGQIDVTNENAWLQVFYGS